MSGAGGRSNELLLCPAVLCCARVFSPEMGSLVFSSKSLRLEKGQANNVNNSFPSSERFPSNNEVNNINVIILSLSILIMDHLPTKSMESVKC